MRKFLKEHLEECKKLLAEIPAYETLTNVAYALEHNLPIKKCVICGKYIPYKNIRVGKDKFCSQECYRSPEGLRLAKEHRMKTNMERFGNPYGYSDETIAKTLATKKAKNNGAYVSQETKDKVRNTMIERYGAPTTFQSEVLHQKMKNTMLKRYGAEHPSHIKSLKIEKQSLKKKEKYTLEKIVKADVNFEKEVKDFIRKYSDFDDNEKFDIFIENKSLAIDCNEINKSSNRSFYLNKTNACEAKGIQLIHIFENEWKDKQFIVKSRLKHILGVVKNKIFARKCTVKEISNILANKFINKYHLQGRYNASVCLGLFYKTHLVAVMTFAKPRFNKNYNWELLRYVTVANFNIVGGASKLLAYFRKNYLGSIISYADRRWSNGNLYRKLGFEELSPSTPSYFYTKGSEVISRFGAQKHKLRKLLKNFDESKTEKENMLANGYNRIYDCGNRVFVLK